MSRDKEEWKVGDRVQWSEWKERVETIHTGAITALITATREKPNYGYYNRNRVPEMETYVEKVTVKWDDGEEETLNQYDVYPEDSPLEREFRLKAPEVLKLIDEKLAIAGKAISEAEAIAEEHGIPFSAGVSPLGQNYLATTFPSKWDGVSKEVVESVTETYAEHGEYYGWQHSAVCY